MKKKMPLIDIKIRSEKDSDYKRKPNKIKVKISGGSAKAGSLEKLLKDKIFERLDQSKASGLPLRIWVPGCSTGEEAFLIAILAYEAFTELGIQRSIQVFASDVSEDAISKARSGSFKEMKHISEKRRKRFFTEVVGRYQVGQVIRDLCIFAHHDVTQDSPFSRMDIILCRDLLGSLSPYLQRRVLTIFGYSLNIGGYLALGSESMVGIVDLFSVVDMRCQVYQKKPWTPGAELNFSSSLAQKVWSDGHENFEVIYGELQSANDEIRSINQQLQMTFRYLETSKKELRLIKDELALVHEKLSYRLQQLQDLQNDLRNLMGYFQWPVVMVGNDLRIKHFNPSAESLLNVVSSDIGKPIFHIKSKFNVKNLERLVHDTIDTLSLRELKVQDSSGRDYILDIRPCQTVEKRVSGAVLLFRERSAL